MKNALKKILSTGLILVTVGVVIFLVGFAISGFNFEKMSGLNIRYESFEETSDILYDKIKINSSVADVEIIVDPQTEFLKISYPVLTDKDGNELNTTDIKISEGSVSLYKKNSLKENFSLWNFTKRKITITVPAERNLTSLEVYVNNGDITLSSYISIDTLKLESDNGDISVTSVASTKIDLDTDNGDIEISGFTVNGNLEIETDNGEVWLGAGDAKRVEVSTDNGDITVVGRIRADLVNFESDNGDIEFKDGKGDLENKGGIIDSKEIFLSTDNGGAEIKLVGSREDYSIVQTIKNGKSNVNSGISGERKITVEIENGNAKIYFEK